MVGFFNKKNSKFETFMKSNRVFFSKKKTEMNSPFHKLLPYDMYALI